jgi:acyl carrier protein
MMNIAENTHAFIRKVCEERMNIELSEEIDFKDPVIKSFKLDSISIFELVVTLEEEYGIGIPDTDVDKISKMSLYELSEYLECQKKEQVPD